MAHDFGIEVKDGKKVCKIQQIGIGCTREEFDTYLQNDKYVIPDLFGNIIIPVADIEEIWNEENHGFHNTNVKYKTEVLAKEYRAYFFGYCGGIMYEAFGAFGCDNGLSGSGNKIELTHEQAMRGLERAIRKFDISDYADPTRMDAIKEFYERFKDCTEQKYIICFS